MDRTLIIGGTRNLGPDLAAALRARGDRVTVLNRGKTPDTLPAGIERLRADRSDPAAFQATLAGREFDLVVDTTLYKGPDAEAVVASLRKRVGRYVFWSTGQVYLVKHGDRGPGTGDRGFREADYDGPVMSEPASEYDRGQWRYGVDKRAAEDVLRGAFAAEGFPYVALRMPMINSRRDHYRRLETYAAAIRAGEAIAAPEGQGPLRHVYGDDVVAATLLAAETRVPAGTCLNIAQDETLTLEQMLQIVADALAKRLTLERAPRAELERKGRLGERAPWSGTWMSVLDNSESKAVLGISYTGPAGYLPALLGG